MAVISKAADVGGQQGSSGCRAAAATDRGRMRRANEDSLAFAADRGAFVVCDGMGGAAAGEIASRLAAEATLSALADAEPGAAALEKAIRVANLAVFAQAAKEARLEGMGTTLVALLLGGRAAPPVTANGNGSGNTRMEAARRRAWVAHVGDSRCYLLRGAALRQLTRDHSWVEEQMRLGRMTPEQARRSPMGNIITRAVGTRPTVTSEIAEVELVSGDVFLLATDGLTRELPDAAIARILLENAEPQAACERLIAAANAAGGRDNITCVVLQIV